MGQLVKSPMHLIDYDGDIPVDVFCGGRRGAKACRQRLYQAVLCPDAQPAWRVHEQHPKTSIRPRPDGRGNTIACGNCRSEWPVPDLKQAGIGLSAFSAANVDIRRLKVRDGATEFEVPAMRAGGVVLTRDGIVSGGFWTRCRYYAILPDGELLRCCGRKTA